MDEPTPTSDTSSKAPLRFRRTRIAVSVFFGTMTLLLCVLWVRSYFVVDRGGRFVATHWIEFRTLPGKLHLNHAPDRDGKPISFWANGSTLGIAWRIHNDFVRLNIPLWMLTGASIAMAYLTWLSWRFSLRTLLIATTLLAAVLGMGVWLAH